MIARLVEFVGVDVDDVEGVTFVSQIVNSPLKSVFAALREVHSHPNSPILRHWIWSWSLSVSLASFFLAPYVTDGLLLSVELWTLKRSLETKQNIKKKKDDQKYSWFYFSMINYRPLDGHLQKYLCFFFWERKIISLLIFNSSVFDFPTEESLNRVSVIVKFVYKLEVTNHDFEFA